MPMSPKTTAPGANINVGESVFTAEWEAGDALGILPVKTGRHGTRHSR